MQQKNLITEVSNTCVSFQAVENYLGHFLGKLQKIWKKFNKLLQQQWGALRAPLLPAIFCTFSICFAIFPKNGPGSFPHARVITLEAALATNCGKLPGPFFGKIAKNIEKVQKNAGKRGARSAPLCCWGNFFVLFPYFCSFSKKWPR